MVKLRFEINSYDSGNWWDNKQDYTIEVIKKKLKEKKKKENERNKD